MKATPRHSKSGDTASCYVTICWCYVCIAAAQSALTGIAGYRRGQTDRWIKHAEALVTSHSCVATNNSQWVGLVIICVDRNIMLCLCAGTAVDWSMIQQAYPRLRLQLAFILSFPRVSFWAAFSASASPANRPSNLVRVQATMMWNIVWADRWPQLLETSLRPSCMLLRQTLYTSQSCSFNVYLRLRII